MSGRVIGTYCLGFFAAAITSIHQLVSDAGSNAFSLSKHFVAGAAQPERWLAAGSGTLWK